MAAKPTPSPPLAGAETGRTSASVDDSSPLGRWVGWTAFVLSLLAVADAIYLTVAHYTTTSVLMCPGNSVVNCAKVTTSSESTFLGMPVAVLGLVFYAVVAVVNWPGFWRSNPPWLRLARLILIAGGMLFVLYLVYAEVVLIGNICIYCTIIHIITLILFGLTMYATAQTGLGLGDSVG